MRTWMPSNLRLKSELWRWLIPISFVLFLFWSNVRLIRSPAAHSDSWFEDGGFILNTVDNLLHGKQLYLDSFYPYGPLPISLYAWLSRFFGNTTTAFSYYLLGVHLACILLIIAVLARAKCDVGATLIVLLGLYPFCVRPLGLQYSFEELCILEVIALWQPPAQRPPARSLLLGAFLGMMQWIRFGSALGPIIGVAAVDFLSVYTDKEGLAGPWLRKLLAAGSLVLGAFCMVEGSLLIQLFVTLPGDVARDVAWPYFMRASYDVYAPQDRHLRWLSLNYFLGNQLGAVPALVSTLFSLAALLVSPKLRQLVSLENQTAYRLFIPAVAYMIDAAFLFQQVWHYYVGAWLLALSAGYYLRSHVMLRRAVLALLFLPGAYVTLRAEFRPASVSHLQMTLTPRGERLWLPPEMVARNKNLMAGLEDFRAKHPSARVDGGGVILLERGPVTVAAPLHFFYLIPQVIPNTMIFPGWLRARDFVAIERAILQGHAVVLLQRPEQGPPPKDICQWNTYSFPKEFCDRLSGIFQDPTPVDRNSWIFSRKDVAERRKE